MHMRGSVQRGGAKGSNGRRKGEKKAVFWGRFGVKKAAQRRRFFRRLESLTRYP